MTNGIKLSTNFTNSDLPQLGSKIGPQIAAMPDLLGWFQADANYVTVSGDEIETFTDRAGGSGYFIRNALTKRADLVQDAIGPFSAANFSGTTDMDDGNADVYVLTDVSIDTSVPYTMIVVYKPEDELNGDTVIGRFSNSTTRAIINLPSSSTDVNFQHGTAKITGSSKTSEWNLAIVSFDGTNLNMYTNVDGTLTPVTASGSTGTNTFVLGALNTSGGQAFDGLIADAMLFQRDIFSNAEDLALIKLYYKNLYGL